MPALLVLVPVVWAACVSALTTVSALPVDSPAAVPRLVLHLAAPIPHVEVTPHLDDDSADPVQLEPLAVGPESGGYQSGLAPIAMLATRDCAMISPLARFPHLPPRPPPATAA